MLRVFKDVYDETKHNPIKDVSQSLGPGLLRALIEGDRQDYDLLGIQCELV